MAFNFLYGRVVVRFEQQHEFEPQVQNDVEKHRTINKVQAL